MKEWLEGQNRDMASATRRIGSYFRELATAAEAHLAAEKAADTDCSTALEAAERAYAAGLATLEEKFRQSRILVAHVSDISSRSVRIASLLSQGHLIQLSSHCAGPRS